MVIDQIACRWSMNYAGIVGRGTLIEITDETERFFVLNCLMANYGKKGGAKFPADNNGAAVGCR